MTEFDLAGFSKAIADRAEAAAALTASITVHRHHSASAFHWRDGLYVAAEESVDPEAEIETTLASGESGQDRDPRPRCLDRHRADQAGRRCGAFAASSAPATSASARSRSSPAATAPSPIAGFGVVNEAGPSWRSMRGGLIDRRIGLSGGLDGRFEGAAALDAEGALIGMVLFGPRRRALVIPAETIDRVAPVLAEKGRVGTRLSRRRAASGPRRTACTARW